MNDEEKLKQLFENKEPSNFNKTVQKAKLLAIIRGFIISILIFIILGFVVLLFNNVTLSQMGHKKYVELNAYYTVTKPNAYIGTPQNDNRFMTGEFDYIQYRILVNKPIIDGSCKEAYSYIPLINCTSGENSSDVLWYGSEFQNQLNAGKSYSKYGKRIMKFYNPSIKYENYSDDLSSLNKTSKDTIMEMSLSFDKSYSIDEVKNILPSDITLNWYWVDTFHSNYSKNLKTIYDENSVYGFKALDYHGNVLSNPEKNFIDTITTRKAVKGNNQALFRSLFYELSSDKMKITKADLRIIGIVVSGDRDSLIQLKDKTFIRASSLGAVADNY